MEPVSPALGGRFLTTGPPFDILFELISFIKMNQIQGISTKRALYWFECQYQNWFHCKAEVFSVVLMVKHMLHLTYFMYAVYWWSPDSAILSLNFLVNGHSCWISCQIYKVVNAPEGNMPKSNLFQHHHNWLPITFDDFKSMIHSIR